MPTAQAPVHSDPCTLYQADALRLKSPTLLYTSPSPPPSIFSTCCHPPPPIDSAQPDRASRIIDLLYKTRLRITRVHRIAAARRHRRHSPRHLHHHRHPILFSAGWRLALRLASLGLHLFVRTSPHSTPYGVRPSSFRVLFLCPRPQSPTNSTICSVSPIQKKTTSPTQLTVH